MSKYVEGINPVAGATRLISNCTSGAPIQDIGFGIHAAIRASCSVFILIVSLGPMVRVSIKVAEVATIRLKSHASPGCTTPDAGGFAISDLMRKTKKGWYCASWHDEMDVTTELQSTQFL